VEGGRSALVDAGRARQHFPAHPLAGFSNLVVHFADLLEFVIGRLCIFPFECLASRITNLV
jgi:hypothetical protein